jgi:hypothetical protein
MGPLKEGLRTLFAAGIVGGLFLFLIVKGR